MSIFSRLKLQDRLLEILKRFPVVIFFAIFTTTTLILMIDGNHGDIFRWPVSAFIGFLAMLNWSVYREAYRLSTQVFYFGVAVIIALLGLYFYMMPTDFAEQISCFWYFTVGLSLLLHFLLSIIPFFKQYDNVSITNFNISLFLSWMQAALYGIVLYAALSLALIAMDQLFDLHIKGLFYFKLFIAITGIFQTSFFLSEIPENFYSTELPAPKSIFRIFTGFVAVPVTLIYGIILYAYTLRITLTDHTMVDWVFVMVLWYFGVGIVSWLFTQYFNNAADNEWMNLFREYFFPASVIPLVLLIFACYSNISASGIKEEYYLATICAASITLIMLYIILSGNKDLRIFPAVLIIFTVLAFMGGPYSMCRLPVSSQQKKLVSLLEQQQIIKDGVLRIDTSLTIADTNGLISEKIYFLSSRNALGFFKEMDQNHIITKPADSLNAQDILTLLRLDQYNMQESNRFWDVNFPTDKPMEISGFDQMIPVKNSYDQFETDAYLEVVKDAKFILHLPGESPAVIDVSQHLSTLSAHPNGNPVAEYTTDTCIVRLRIISANGEFKDNQIQINHLTAFVFIRKNDR